MHSLVKFLRLKPFDDAKLWEFWIGLKTVSKTKDSTTRLSTIGKSLILRRTKAEIGETGGDVPSIPPKTVKEVKVKLSDEERKVYDHLRKFAE
jgi:SNF2 family DNA or RNA helicase